MFVGTHLSRTSNKRAETRNGSLRASNNAQIGLCQGAGAVERPGKIVRWYGVADEKRLRPIKDFIERTQIGGVGRRAAGRASELELAL